MFSPQVIADLALQAAVKAAAYSVEPYHPVSTREVENWKRAPITNLGDFRPDGWYLVDHELVDATGWGHEDEPALTLRGFKQWVIETGQFQVVVGYFSQDATKAGEDTNGKREAELAWHECVRCEEPVPDGETVCPYCQWDSAAEHCPECDEEVDEDTTTCSCGHVIREEPDETDHWDEGYQAREAGVSLQDNPHERGSENWYDWQSGWTTAHTVITYNQEA